MSRIKLQTEIFLVVFLTLRINGIIASTNTIRPHSYVPLGVPTHAVNGELISLEFYNTMELAESAKNDLQSLFHNFFENLQRNLSTSYILNNMVYKSMEVEMNQYKLNKLDDLANYFQHSSEAAARFAQRAELFFEASKNESYSLLLKLRQVPSAQRYLPNAVKIRLTDYFAEMEFFHIMLSEIINQALEYVVDNLRLIQRIFTHYADIQRDMLRTWYSKSDELCSDIYMNFLQQWSAQIFKCGTGNDLLVSYDIYGSIETSTKYIMRQLEFRIQRLYNCFIFGNFEMRCQFLRKYEKDFENLFGKLDELQQYFDIKIKHGRVAVTRSNRRRRHEEHTNYYGKCIPYGFPHNQMEGRLKTCFLFPNSIAV